MDIGRRKHVGITVVAVLSLSALIAGLTAAATSGETGENQVRRLIDGSSLGNNTSEGYIHIPGQQVEGPAKIHNDNRDICMGNCEDVS